jgi:bifunctional UDP-N-acetylglucosamine pyrophosphorylase/glucosamine-1-phosphate N-acetyltransferase
MQVKFEPTIIILSAGNGERMCSSTPKLLHKVACQSLIKYVLKVSAIISPSPSNIYMVINKELHENEQFKAMREQHTFNHVIQENRLGTGDAVKTAYNKIKKLNDVILILYGDTPFIMPKTLYSMLDQIIAGSDLSIIGFDAKNPTGYGRIISSGDNRLVDIVEDKYATAEQKKISLCNSGVMFVKKEVLADFLTSNEKTAASLDNEFYLTDIAKHATKAGKTCTYLTADEGEVMGINDREQLSFAENYVQKIKRKELMDGGVTIINPETSYFAFNAKIYPDVIIYPNVFIGKNTTILNQSIIHSFSHLEGVFIEKGVSIGPFARIRPNSKIGNGSKIGNFVEVKNATLMDNVKSSHLAYIGDATIHNDVNIGAGTIFCNYDGQKKHHTEVEEKAFIGANSSIISPVVIKERATIAAGSVITNDVGKGDLAIARAVQINLKNKSKNAQ